jgi:hypothetical protein
LSSRRTAFERCAAPSSGPMVQPILNPGRREPVLAPRSVPFTEGGFLMRRRLSSAAPTLVAALVVVGLVLALGALGACGAAGGT